MLIVKNMVCIATMLVDATMGVLVAACVVFVGNCGLLAQMGVVGTNVNNTTILITNQGTTLLKTDIIITFYAEIA